MDFLFYLLLPLPLLLHSSDTHFCALLLPWTGSSQKALRASLSFVGKPRFLTSSPYRSQSVLSQQANASRQSQRESQILSIHLVSLGSSACFLDPRHTV